MLLVKIGCLSALIAVISAIGFEIICLEVRQRNIKNAIIYGLLGDLAIGFLIALQCFLINKAI